MIKFNDNNIYVQYIKNFLTSFNLPTIPVWKSGMKVYSGCQYLNGSTIIKALNTGEFSTVDDINFNVISDTYYYNKEITNLTKNLVISNFDYDSYTHEYLGDYLRFYRDYRGIDLMSMYNCANNSFIDNVTIKDTLGKTILSSSDGAKIYAIKIVPYNEYTIFIDSAQKVEMVVGYVSNGKVVNLFEDSTFKFPYELTYFSKTDCSFNKPFVYDKMNFINLQKEEWKNSLNTESYNKREDLRLLIKVPDSSNESSLVVLEGNYLENSRYHFSNTDLKLVNYIYATDGINKNTNIKYISKLGLTSLNSGVLHPFSNRLLEYLFQNVILPFDEIDNNISRVQSILVNDEKKNYHLDYVKFDGEWDEELRRILYLKAKAANLTDFKYDIIGYVDKDIESLISLEDK